MGVGNRTESDATNFGAFPLFWLGHEFEGYHLDRIDETSQTAPMGRENQSFTKMSFSYGECIPIGSGERPSCRIPVNIQLRSVCFIRPEQLADAAKFRTGSERGRAQSVFFRDGHVEMWTGKTHITIHSPGQPALGEKAIGALRSFGTEPEGAEPGTILPPPDFSECT